MQINAIHFDQKRASYFLVLSVLPLVVLADTTFSFFITAALPRAVVVDAAGVFLVSKPFFAGAAFEVAAFFVTIVVPALESEALLLLLTFRVLFVASRKDGADA
jgi:hypothetical protein